MSPSGRGIHYHLNRWTEADDSWVSPSDWDACAATVDLKDGQDVFLRVDIGGQKDSSAVVVAGWVGDVLHVRSWIGEPDDKRTVSTHEARARIVEAADRYTVREAAYDRTMFRESAQELEERGLMMVDFDQGHARMAPASSTLLELIRDRRWSTTVILCCVGMCCRRWRPKPTVAGGSRSASPGRRSTGVWRWRWRPTVLLPPGRSSRPESP